MATESILITGASSDIGCALIRHLLSGPNPPLILAHSFRSGHKLKALQTEFGEALKLLEADFSQPAPMAALTDEILAAHGVPVGFVHLPALRLNYDRFTKLNWNRFEVDLNVQVRSAVVLLQRLLPKMVKLPRARVVFVLSSVVHGVPPKFMSAYTILKYTQLGLMRALAAEYAATPVRINAISPSMVETQFLQEIAEVAVQMSASANPQGRNATPADLLGAFDLLLSPASDYIHGVDLPIAAGSVN
jgi:3-oxoacyl-[acyl-carrier protein] reductase